jgi:hypothetical protein
MEDRKNETIELKSLLLVFDMHQRAKEIWAEKRGKAPPEGYDWDLSFAAETCAYDEHWDQLGDWQRWIFKQYGENSRFQSFSELFEKYRYCEEELHEISYDNRRRLLDKILEDKELVKAYTNHQDTFADLIFYRERMELEDAHDERMRKIREHI